MPDSQGLFALPMFFLGGIAPARGLHEGLAQAIASKNPHAAAPLLRQFVETLAAVGFVNMDDELSEATHYGGTAFAFPFQTDQDDDSIVHWQAEPRWKDAGSALVICRG